MLGNILAVGLMSMGMGLSGVKDEPQMYAENAETYSITYTVDDWKEKDEEIYQWLSSNNYDGTNKLSISGSMTVNDTPRQLAYICYVGNPNQIIIRTNTESDFVYTLSNETWNNTVTGNIVITSQTYFEAMREPTMGSDIVGTIASGLGIIGALASNFLVGFGALFYSSGALTPFAIFALVMLGVAVSFAVVKLVLNLIRSNTGA